MHRSILAALLFLCPPAFAGSKLDPLVRQALKAAPRAAGGGGFGIAAAGGSAAADIPQGSLDVLIRLAPGYSRINLQASYPGAEFRPQAGDVVTARVPLALLEAFERDPFILQVAGPRKLKPALHVARSSTTSSGAILGVLANGLTDLYGVSGTSVVVGIVDTGIDWCHNDFRFDELGATNVSRILNIWDQTISSDAAGPFPSGYSYGAEYDNSDINTDLAAGCNFATVRSVDTDGHGTHVAGIAAGDGSATNGNEPAGKYTGIAPNADLIIVKTNLQNYGVVDAMNYIAARAAALGKPVVINLSLGSQAGPHDGTDPFESAVGAIAANTPVAVAMGNDHNDSPHARTTIGSGGSATFTVDMSNANDVVYAEFWHNAGDSYTVDVTPTCGVCTGSVTALSGVTASQVFGASTITVFNSTMTNANGDDSVLVVIEDPNLVINPANIQFTRTAAGGDGIVDGWVDPAIDKAKFSGGLVNNATTITSPATANNVIAVGAHVSLTSWGSGTISETLGDIASYSGRGPTRDNRTKPDVSAPGAAVASSSSAYQSPSPGSQRLADGRHFILQGTSMATPMTTGAIALKLQVQPAATVSSIRSWIQTHARSDTKTGTLPNNTYGYGKLLGTPKIIFSPTGLSATSLGASSISFNWGLVEGATDYHLFYSTNTTSLVARVTAPPFVFQGLGANVLTGLFVRGANAVGLGPGGTSPSTATYASDPGAAPTYTAHVTSVTAAFGNCAGTECSGYRLVASTAANMTGVQFSSSTPNRLTTQLTVAGLAPSTSYYFRFAALNQLGAMSAIDGGQTMTTTDLVAPGFASLTTSESGAVFNWTTAGNPFNTVYRADASTAANFSGTVQTYSGANLTAATFSGLSANTTHYFRVQGTPGGPFLYQTLATTSLIPGATVPAFSSPQIAQFTVAWSSGGNPPDTLYRAEAAADAGFTAIVASSQTRNLFADMTGLTANTSYFARVRSVSHGGTPSSYFTIGSTPTLADPPVTGSPAFSNQIAGGFRVLFSPGTNPAGTLFQARISTDSAFNGTILSSFTRNNFADFSGLTSNQTYYFNAAALNHSGVPSAFSGPRATATVAAVPGAAVPLSSAPAQGSLRFFWGLGGNAAASSFLAQVDDDPTFSTIDGASATANAFALFTGLANNTVYYARARTTSASPPNPDSAFAALGSSSTLTDPPGFAAGPFVSVTYGSVTVQWTALPLAPQTATCEGYRVEASTDPAFNGTVFAGGVVGAAASLGGVSGLSHSTTYYVRVGALNWDGVANYLILGATRTAAQTIAVGTVTTSGAQFSILPVGSPLTAITVRAPPGAFPVGTILTLNTSVELGLPEAKSNQAALTALSGAAFSLAASNGLQPLLPVVVTLSYAPGLLPSGQSAKTLQLARYDESARQWSLLPSVVDAAANAVIAQAGHFSLFGAFFVSAARDLDAAQVFPIPWEPGSRDARFNAVELTVSNLPADSRVRAFSISGELVWEGRANAAGIFTWHGKNRYGRPVGTGTYVLIIEGAGKRLSARAVIVR